MKPGITQLCLSRQDLEADLSKARNLGYEAIELVFSDEGSPNLDAPTASYSNRSKAVRPSGAIPSSASSPTSSGGAAAVGQRSIAARASMLPPSRPLRVRRWRR